MLLVYVVCKDKDEAYKIGRILLDKDLIACTNFWPVESMYEWQTEIVEDTEYVLLLKTKKDNYKDIEKIVLENHSYEIPAIFAWKIDQVNEKYMNWLNNQC